MTENRPFGFDPEDFDRKARALGDGIRETLRGIGKLIDDAGFETVWETSPGRVVAYPRRKTTTGDTGDGVWAIVLVAEDGTATVEQVHATELDALRANKTNTDPQRRVRFLPYGIAVSALDDDTGSGSDADVEPDPEH
ncbi:hypothetical protein [Rhodococcus triatomae]|nr:hypothetical protein G419_02245 [Rhodococcus triatomae BKS 15-14]